MATQRYTVTAKIWLYQGQAAWHFLSVPKKESAEIKASASLPRRGWGSVPVTVALGNTTWKTSIFPDKASGMYLLPLKAAVRNKEEVEEGDLVEFTITISH